MNEDNNLKRERERERDGAWGGKKDPESEKKRGRERWREGEE